MITDQIVVLLISERDKLNRAIEALTGQEKRRGRPPKNAATAIAESAAPEAPPAKKTRKKRLFSEAEREAARLRMKQMWAKRKRAAKKAA